MMLWLMRRCVLCGRTTDSWNDTGTQNRRLATQAHTHVGTRLFDTSARGCSGGSTQAHMGTNRNLSMFTCKLLVLYVQIGKSAQTINLYRYFPDISAKWEPSLQGNHPHIPWIPVFGGCSLFFEIILYFSKLHQPSEARRRSLVRRVFAPSFFISLLNRATAVWTSVPKRGSVHHSY